MATVRFRLEKREHREYSIMARFTLNASDRFAISTGERIDPKFWDNQLQQVKATHPDHVSINVFLSKFKANLLTLYRDNHSLSFEEFKALAKNNPTVQKKSLLSLFPEFLSEVNGDSWHFIVEDIGAL